MKTYTVAIVFIAMIGSSLRQDFLRKVNRALSLRSVSFPPSFAAREQSLIPTAPSKFICTRICQSGKSYPVVYYFHTVFSSPDKTLEDGNLVKLMERGFTNSVTREFILVVADYTSPTTGSLYENSTATAGGWTSQGKNWSRLSIQNFVRFVTAIAGPSPVR